MLVYMAFERENLHRVIIAMTREQENLYRVIIAMTRDLGSQGPPIWFL